MIMNYFVEPVIRLQIPEQIAESVEIPSVTVHQDPMKWEDNGTEESLPEDTMLDK